MKNLPFPKSLLEFQQLFPNDAACAAYMEPFAESDPQVAEEQMPLIHLVFSNLKAWLLGIHHGVSPQHLQAYLNEFTFRFNRRFYPFNSFRSILGIGSNTESLTYAELYDADCKHPSFTDVAFVGES
jgi:hypothetical protein